MTRHPEYLETQLPRYVCSLFGGFMFMLFLRPLKVHDGSRDFKLTQPAI